ncbi:ATP-binding protein [Reyranella sp.]|uniref:ATP-binding protein n=1 Tax=Reyranella sp. TaxID=1929291 RepID=UPI003BAC2120
MPQRPPLPETITASQWRQIVNGATDTAIISTDPEGRVTSWNAGAQLILGWTEAEMLGRTLEILFPGEDGPGRIAREMADAVATGRGGGDEGWRRRKDGTLFWATGEVAPIREDGSAIVGFIKIVRDRTQRRQAEEALRTHRHRLEILNKAGSALAIEHDLERLVQIVTDAGVELIGAQFGAFFYNVLSDAGESYMLYTLSGAPREAFAGFPMPRNTAVFAPTFGGEGIVRSDDITQDPRYGQNAPRQGMPEGHLPVRSYLAVPVISRSGGVIGGLFFGHAEPAIFNEQSEGFLLGLAAEAAVAIDNARLRQANEAEIRDRRRAEEALRQLNATLEAEVRQRTEQLRTHEEALRQAQKMEAIGQLTGGVAHDFNNLLQIIMGSLETLLRELPPESSRLARAAANAMTGARRAASLTQRLLAFARRQPLAPKPLTVNLLVNGMSEMIQRTLGETIAVEVVVAAGGWTVEVDPTELEGAILNLCVNARDAMPEGGRLTIETANVEVDRAYAASHPDVAPGQYVTISVSDTGVGMTSETIGKAFEPFFTTKPVGQGTGLGLSQVYGFVRQSGGHVTLYSEPDQGTTVRLYLPRFHGRTEEASAAAEPPMPAGSPEETILVVEDDADVRAQSVQTLRDLGYRVIEAGDGPTALRTLETADRLDLLFTDVVLPNSMTGAELAARAGALRPALKVLFTTGYARNAIVHHGRLDRGVELLVKPFSATALAARVRDLLDS